MQADCLSTDFQQQKPDDNLWIFFERGFPFTHSMAMLVGHPCRARRAAH
jgi:hypothetical protein